MVTGQGNTNSNSSRPYRTNPAPPLAGATVNGTALNHTSVLVTWFPPGIQTLRGTVASYTLEIEDTSAPSSPVSRVGRYPGDKTRATVTNLKANTVYKFYVSFVSCYPSEYCSKLSWFVQECQAIQNGCIQKPVPMLCFCIIFSSALNVRLILSIYIRPCVLMTREFSIQQVEIINSYLRVIYSQD